MRDYKLLIAFQLIFFYCQSFSQKEVSKWYFGNQNGLDFTTSPPTILNNGMITSPISPNSIADATGNLLFYTDGKTVWNKQHVVMGNGANLCVSTGNQGGLIIKQPGNSNIYYIISEDSGNGETYSIVDMSLAAGMGSVTIKSVPIYYSCIGLHTAVKHSNGMDIWVISHEYLTNNFRAYLLTSSGLSTVPVVSAVGPAYLQSGGGGGGLKATANGRKIGVVSGSPKFIGLYDFDPTTGLLSNPVPLNNTLYGHDCEFSPDGTKFYATAYLTNFIFQWDLCVSSNSLIASTEYSISSATIPAGLQLAPDGKIYVAYPAKDTLGIIQNPNKQGAGCNFLFSGQPLSSACGQNLPNFMRSYFKVTPGAFNYTVDLLSCGNATFTAPCNNLNTYTSTTWFFGDPSGTSNSSTLSTATHSYTAPGSYTVKLALHATSGTDTLYQVVNYPFPVPTLSISGRQVICAGETTTITVNGATTYSWSNNLTNASIVITPTTSTQYTVTGTSTCTASKQVSVTVKPCLGIGENADAFFICYPNPTTSKLFIETKKDTRILIYNNLGQILISEKITGPKSEIDLSGLSDGLYFMKVEEPGLKFLRILKFE
jgi:hypothetical protein